MGCGSGNDYYLTTGSIDLNNFLVYINGDLFYQPCLKIPYTLSSTGSKIVDVVYRSRVQNLYEQDGKALYYTLDEDNNNFTLPMGEIYGMMKSYVDENAETINETIEEKTAYVYPIGEPHITLSDTLNDNEIWLEGAEVSKTTYSALYAIYGDTYGTAESEDNFVLPDFRGRVIQGSEGFGYISAGLPNITGTVTTYCSVSLTPTASGAFTTSTTDTSLISTSAGTGRTQTINFYASNSNLVYGKSTTVQPEAIKVRVKTRYI